MKEEYKMKLYLMILLYIYIVGIYTRSVDGLVITMMDGFGLANHEQ